MNFDGFDPEEYGVFPDDNTPDYDFYNIENAKNYYAEDFFNNDIENEIDDDESFEINFDEFNTDDVFSIDLDDKDSEEIEEYPL